MGIGSGSPEAGGGRSCWGTDHSSRERGLDLGSFRTNFTPEAQGPSRAREVTHLHSRKGSHGIFHILPNYQGVRICPDCGVGRGPQGTASVADREAGVPGGWETGVGRKVQIQSACNRVGSWWKGQRLTGWEARDVHRHGKGSL